MQQEQSADQQVRLEKFRLLQQTLPQSISFCPRGNKRFFLCDPEGGSRTVVDAPIYWFNDMDYHGVLADPFIRYSIRVDGVFAPGFVETLRDRTVTSGRGPAR
jgi:hypothetical protein